jgi:hypothetical protein
MTEVQGRPDVGADVGAAAVGGAVGAKIMLSDFIADLENRRYFYVPTMKPWPGGSVDAVIPTGKGSPPAHTWLDRNQAVECITYAPGLPLIIEGRYMVEGGWRDHPDGRTLNLYRAPDILKGSNVSVLSMEQLEFLAHDWISLIHYLWPAQAEHIIRYFAWIVQHPDVKINHALLLMGAGGIGKDRLVTPVRIAVGAHNFKETRPEVVMESAFTDYLRCVLLRINEARDQGEIDRRAFYDRIKWITAAPPETHVINEKHIRPYSIPNVNGTIITSNHKTGAIFPEPDDRRLLVCWSERTRDDFEPGYFDALERWYEHGDAPFPSGYICVAAYLSRLDLSEFNPHRPPPRTPAFYDLLASSIPPEAARLADVLDRMNRPAIITLEHVKTSAINGHPEASNWLSDPKNWKAMPHRFEQCDYARVPSETKDRMWKIGIRRTTVYAHKEMSPGDRARGMELLKDTNQAVHWEHLRIIRPDAAKVADDARPRV